MNLTDFFARWVSAGMTRPDSYGAKLQTMGPRRVEGVGSIVSYLSGLLSEVYTERIPSPVEATYFALQNFAMRAMPPHHVFAKFGALNEQDLWALCKDTQPKRAVLVAPRHIADGEYERMLEFTGRRQQDGFRTLRTASIDSIEAVFGEFKAKPRMVSASLLADSDVWPTFVDLLATRVGAYVDVIVEGSHSVVAECLAAVPWSAAGWYAARFRDGRVVALASARPDCDPIAFPGLDAMVENTAKHIAYLQLQPAAPWIVPPSEHELHAHLAALARDLRQGPSADGLHGAVGDAPLLVESDFPEPRNTVARESPGLCPMDFAKVPHVHQEARLLEAAPPDRPVFISPWCLAGAVGPGQSARFRSRWSVPRIDCLELPGARVFGRGLVATSTGHLVVGHPLVLRRPEDITGGRDDLKGRWQDGRFVPNLDNRHVRMLQGSYVLLTKKADHIFGHWLLDILPRVAVARAAGIGTEVGWLIAQDTPGFAREMLALCGIGADQLVEFDPKSEVVACERLYVPSVCRFAGGLSSLARRVFDSMRERAGVDSSSPADRLLYVSRSRWIQRNQSRRLVNVDRLREVVLSLGFEEVFPEDMSMCEQVRLFDSARAIVGECGSGLHGAAFSRPSTYLLVVQASGNGNVFQTAIGTASRQSVGYVFGEHFRSPDLGFIGDYIVDETVVRRALIALVEYVNGVDRFLEPSSGSHHEFN